MSFTFDFALPDDTLHFAYSIPYPYSRLLKFLAHLPLAKLLPPLKSLSALPTPLLEVTDYNEPEYNKQAVLVTARIHPGESNSSFVAEGLLEYLCGNEGKGLRRDYVFYVVPMVNPDGVVGGNYRTSLFGKDLNRTFSQARRFAFPETYQLVELARELKATHKRRLNLYIDLHGHSVKKNVFMYGPDFGIQHLNYDLSRELPRLLGNLTSLFRYYSCIFRISNAKASTARAVLNRRLDIPFTYTLEASNGFYLHPTTKTETPFSSGKYKEVGAYLAKALSLLEFDQHYRIRKVAPQAITKDDYRPPSLRDSDDDISEGGSDSEPDEQDFSERELEGLMRSIEGREESKEGKSPTKFGGLKKMDSQELRPRKERGSVFLPPINSLNRAAIFSNRNKMKEAMRHERLRNMQSLQGKGTSERQHKPRLSVSQLVTDYGEGSHNTLGRYRRGK